MELGRNVERRLNNLRRAAERDGLRVTERRRPIPGPALRLEWVTVCHDGVPVRTEYRVVEDPDRENEITVAVPHGVTRVMRDAIGGGR